MRRGAPRGAGWKPSPTEQLNVLARQIKEAIAEGEDIKKTAYSGGWGAWETNLGR